MKYFLTNVSHHYHGFAKKIKVIICSTAVNMVELMQEFYILSGVPVIDAEGYRANVGIVIINDRGQVFWARRFGQHSWQYPQGGVDEGESAEETMYRELHEEVGLKPEHV